MEGKCFLTWVMAAGLVMAEPVIPPVLEPWRDWVLAGEALVHSPARFDDAGRRLGAWPSVLGLEVDGTGGRFSLEVEVFDEAWVWLPGDARFWPQAVRSNDQPVVVVEREGGPAVWLGRGRHQLSGLLEWDALPEQVRVPPSIGLLRLIVQGAAVEVPNWDEEGRLWLQRTPGEAAEEDQLGVRVYRLLSDGIPMWLTTSVELTVAGKNREVEIGHALPDGWRLARVTSPLPCLIDETGLTKVQVRPGTWTLQMRAFRTQSQESVGFAAGTRPMVASELLALQPDPTVRVVEVNGLAAVDASQTTFPAEWRAWTVYVWETAQSFRIEEKMRGMGMEKPSPPSLARELWLDEDGRALTFRDQIVGAAQRIWRLDASAGQELGAVKAHGVSQLITRNPLTGLPGVEVRDRALSLEAVGRAPLHDRLPATGWQTVAGPVQCEWHLPPGWRMVALFGAEWVQGDWLTTWSLLDVFLLLVFSLAVQRLWGWRAGVVAFGAFVLAYHEPGAPRWTWLLLVTVLAAGRAVAGVRPVLLRAWRGVLVLTVLALLWFLVPFFTRQVTGLLYPQLERGAGIGWGSAVTAGVGRAVLYRADSDASVQAPASAERERYAQQAAMKSNLAYDQSAQIQTGPAVPQWTWRSVRYGWNGPVAAGQSVRPILLTGGGQRVVIVMRLGLLLGLLYVLLRRPWGVVPPAAPLDKPSAGPPPLPVTACMMMVAAGWMLCGFATVTAQVPAPGGAVATDRASAGRSVDGRASPDGSFSLPIPGVGVLPSDAWLAALRERLMRPHPAFPRAAEIARAALQLDGRRLELTLEVHAAVEVAVPVPGRLPTWSPLTVQLDDQPATAVQRLDGSIWVVVPAGVHEVRVTGVLPPGPEWEWSFALAPRRVSIDARGWVVTGVDANGVPENQVFFTEQEAGAAPAAAYDRRDFHPLVAIERHLEIGLVWKVRTVARRLTDKGSAIAVTIPLLPTERLLTAAVTTADGRAEVRLGAQDEAVEWLSELSPHETLVLQAEVSDRWVERWHLEASPVWHISMDGLAPTYDDSSGALIPVWRPWPGESVTLAVAQPEAMLGQTMTIRQVRHETQLGGYQRATALSLDIHASLGHDLAIALPADAEVTALTNGGERVPVRLSDGQVMVPVRPGEQSISVQWTAARSLTTRAGVDALRLPVDSANVTTTVAVPAQRWVLWASGPLRGPAVRFWSLLVCALFFAWGLGAVPWPTFRRWEWALLLVGLTQTSLAAAFFFVLFVFAVAARGRFAATWGSRLGFNLMQVALAGGLVLAAAVLLSVLHVGLLGDPRMFIRGEGSTTSLLRWFQPRSGPELPVPTVISVSIWIYRLLMLAWALWLAFALLRWVKWGWQQATAGGLWRSRPPRAAVPSDHATP